MAKTDVYEALKGPLRRILRGPPVPREQTLIEKVARFSACEMIEGDYLEFGVYRGHSFAAAYKALHTAFQERIAQVGDNATVAQAAQRQEIWDAMRFVAFDSFEGLPALTGIDTDSRDFRAGQYASGIDEFRNEIQQQGVPPASTVLVPGWFSETCTKETRLRHKITKAAVVWIDGDLYESAVSALEFITPLLQDGTVIIFDDWYAFRGNPRRGEQRAFAEWQARLEGFTASEYQKRRRLAEQLHSLCR